MKVCIQNWLKANSLSALEIDCVCSIMLKILDGKCKMNEAEKQIIAVLYHEIKHLPGQLLDNSIRDLITLAKTVTSVDEQLLNTIYEHRVLAESKISRPVMKAFKAKLAASGLYACYKS